MRTQARRVPAFALSLGLHLVFLAALLLVMWRGARVAKPVSEPPCECVVTPLVWRNDPGPGGGGGGGGDHTQQPPQRAELPGRDAITVPAVTPRAPDLSKPATTEPEQLPRLVIPVTTLASATESLPGSIDAPEGPPTVSQGPGDGGGAGSGKGTGDGPGLGPGLRRGRDGGTGGDAYQAGNGVTMPVEIQKGTPRYTTDAMRARIQGSILVECIVETSGACSRIHVKRSFDPAFGLDEQAIKAAAEWRFRPGTLRGQPVPVMVTMEIAFALR